jgi:serine/threonine protein phosphatase 1
LPIGGARVTIRLLPLNRLAEFVAVPTTPRVIAIGDIHGCNTALATLIDGLKPVDHDTIIMLGDAVDRGPDSSDVIRQLMALRERCRVVCLQGNHEQMLLDALDGRMPIQEWLVHGGAETLDSYRQGAGMNALDAGHVKFIRTWGDVFESDSHFFAHGNYLATRPLNRWRDLRWQSLKWHTPEPHISGKTAVLGHTSNKQGDILNLGHLLCIDTYCHGGGWMTAFDAATGRVWQSNEQGEFRRNELPPIQSAVAVQKYP